MCPCVMGAGCIRADDGLSSKTPFPPFSQAENVFFRRGPNGPRFAPQAGPVRMREGQFLCGPIGVSRPADVRKVTATGPAN